MSINLTVLKPNLYKSLHFELNEENGLKVVAFKPFCFMMNLKHCFEEKIMKNGARYRAVAEIVAKVFEDKLPADNVVNTYLRERKYIGSKDRRFIVEKVWDMIRHRRRLSFEAGGEDVRKMLLVYLKDENLDLIFGADEYALPPLSKEEKQWLKALPQTPYPADVELETPKWLFDKIGNEVLLRSMNTTAPADLRINTRCGRDEVLAKLRAEGLFFAKAPYSPIGIRSEERVNLNNCMAYQNGEVDVQDEASQLAAILCDARPELEIMDYCAGAGGKTLTMLYLMHNQGKIAVHDINWGRLEAIKDRALRLGAKEFEIIKDLPNRQYDLFVLDAPCSGSGTWRRSPDAKFRITPEKLKEIVGVQRQVLDVAYKHTKRGGRIVYMTCSILEDENQTNAQWFESKYKDVKRVNLRQIWECKLDMRYPFRRDDEAVFSPLLTGTEGFYLVMFQKS